MVDDVSFTIEKGEILGFLGPNGAGKSTTMRMITGFIPPSEGTAIIGGSDIRKDSLEARKKIGYLPENAPVYPDMTVTGYLMFCAEIRGFKGNKRKKKVDETIEKCFLTDVLYQPIGTLSKGFKQRVCFAQSIIHDPEYLIFDEPTDGLDPNQKHEVRTMIRAMAADKGIILSTHILDEMEAVCTRAVIIAGGRIIEDDTPWGLRAKSALHGAVFLKVAGAEKSGLLSAVGSVEGVERTVLLEEDSAEISVRVYPKDTDGSVAGRIVNTLSESGYEVKSLFVEQGRLDEVFRKITAPVEKNQRAAVE